MRRYDLLKKKGIIGMAVMLSQAKLTDDEYDVILENSLQDRWLLWLREEIADEGQKSYGKKSRAKKGKRSRAKK